MYRNGLVGYRMGPATKRMLEWLGPAKATDAQPASDAARVGRSGLFDPLRLPSVPREVAARFHREVVWTCMETVFFVEKRNIGRALLQAQAVCDAPRRLRQSPGGMAMAELQRGWP